MVDLSMSDLSYMVYTLSDLISYVVRPTEVSDLICTHDVPFKTMMCM